MNDSFYIDTLAENSHLEGKLKLLKEREAENDIVKNKENLELKNLEKNLKTLKGEIKSLEADQKASRGSGNFFSFENKGLGNFGIIQFENPHFLKSD